MAGEGSGGTFLAMWLAQRRDLGETGKPHLDFLLQLLAKSRSLLTRIVKEIFLRYIICY